MKIRNGFVSNSSSSSFIVAVEKNSGPLTLKINIEKECEIISTIEQLEKHFDDYYCNDAEKAESEKYQACVKAINEGKILKLFSASNEDYNQLSGFYGYQLSKDDVVGDVEIIDSGNY